MTTKAIEAGARAIALYDGSDWDGKLGSRECVRTRCRTQAQACIEAAIASGELVPASGAHTELANELARRLQQMPVCTTDLLLRRVERALRSMVPASAVAAERERCAKICDERSSELIAQGDEQRIGRDDGGRFFSCQSDLAEELAAAIRALEPASGEYVSVPRVPSREMLNAAIDVDSFKLRDISPLGFRESPQRLFERCWTAMLNAATSNWSGK